MRPVQRVSPSEYRGLFVPYSPNSARWSCIICGVTGFPGDPSAAGKWWGHAHAAGHPAECMVCGKVFTSRAGAFNHVRLSLDRAHQRVANPRDGVVRNMLTNDEWLAKQGRTRFGVRGPV